MVDPSMHRIFAMNISTTRRTLTPNEIFKSDGKLRKFERLDARQSLRNVEYVKHPDNVLNFKWLDLAFRQSPMELDPSKTLACQQMQLFFTERKLQAARKRMERKKRELSKEWQELEENEKALRNNFISFSKFVEENNEKRMRSRKKIAEEELLIVARQEEIVKLVEKIKNMQLIESLMNKHIHNLSHFKDFLLRVIEISDEFKSVKDITDRFQNVTSARKMLSAQQWETMDILQNAKNSMMKLIEEKNFVIMGLNNQIANLQARYENANIKALESEELVTQIKNNAVKQLEEIDSVKNSIWNVYIHMATSKKHPIKIKKDNVEEQMMYINRTLTELCKVNKLIKKRSTKAKP